jgi:hypothetical protein
MGFKHRGTIKFMNTPEIEEHTQKLMEVEALLNNCKTLIQQIEHPEKAEPETEAFNFADTALEPVNQAPDLTAQEEGILGQLRSLNLNVEGRYEFKEALQAWFNEAVTNKY